MVLDTDPERGDTPNTLEVTGEKSEKGEQESTPPPVHDVSDTESAPRERTFSGSTVVLESRDKYLVDWESDQDPDNPLNWDSKKKWKNLTIVSSITLIT